MHWKAKAIIQNAVSTLPRALGDRVYYAMQRRFGTFRALDRSEYFAFAARMNAVVRSRDRAVDGSTVLEIGTGWDMAVPLALRLAGARRVITVDLNPHLRPELVREVLLFLRDEPEQVRQAFGEMARAEGFESRRAELVDVLKSPDGVIPPGIEYRAPADASRLDLPPDTVDLHVSRSVLEHVPPQAIPPILTEARRVLRPGGLLVHCVDFSDHFSHSDARISSAHFLRYSDSDWKRWAGNRFMFHNRLRVDDLERIFRESGLDPVAIDAKVDPRARTELADGQRLDARFRGRSLDSLATVEAWLVAEKA